MYLKMYTLPVCYAIASYKDGGTRGKGAKTLLKYKVGG